MPKKDKNIDDFWDNVSKIKNAGISNSKMLEKRKTRWDKLQTIEERTKEILGIINNDKRPPTNMLFFVMYDIEDNKVRNYISKYLIRKGCFRIQKSIFLADLSSAVYDQIKKDLSEVQEMYDNQDSIIVVPISTDYLSSMKIIGATIDVDIITKKKNTLFF